MVFFCFFTQRYQACWRGHECKTTPGFVAPLWTQSAGWGPCWNPQPVSADRNTTLVEWMTLHMFTCFACFIWWQRECDWEPASSDGGDGEISRDAERSPEEERERVWGITPPDERASGQRTEVLLVRFKHCIIKLILNCCKRILIWLQQSLHSCSDEICVFCRLTIKDNVEMIKLQKLLSEKANTLTVLEGRFLQQQEVRLTVRDSSDKKIIV